MGTNAVQITETPGGQAVEEMVEGTIAEAQKLPNMHVAGVTEPVTGTAVVQPIETEKLQQGIKIAELEAQVRVLNEKLVAVRTAKDGYKAIASQGCKDLVYVKKMVGMVYAERRADEMQKEFAAVKDEN